MQNKQIGILPSQPGVRQPYITAILIDFQTGKRQLESYFQAIKSNSKVSHAR
jgi:hypothetical protein